MRQDYENPVSGNLQDEIVLDGVRYANLQQAGQQWRIGAVNPAWVRGNDWSTRRDEVSRLTPYNWLFIQSCSITVNGVERRIYLPRRCLHCLNPQCVTLCSTGSLRQSNEGAVYSHRSTCLGDGPCDRACPWGIPQRQAGVGPYLNLAPRYVGNGQMFKCDYCSSLLKAGESPACVTACPQGAMRIGPREEMATLAKEMAEQRGGDIFGLKENGGTNTIYVSSVLFRDIEANMMPSMLSRKRIQEGTGSIKKRK